MTLSDAFKDQGRESEDPGACYCGREWDCICESMEADEEEEVTEE